jgi:hypothetical protein
MPPQQGESLLDFFDDSLRLGAHITTPRRATRLRQIANDYFGNL